MKSSANAYKRCRPLLGTFVEISLWGDSEEGLAERGQIAFQTIETISRSMSFHDPESELSALNARPIGKWLNASELLLKVLNLALELQKKSGGCFNVATARPLVSWGMLPGQKRKYDWKNMRVPGFEVQGNRVRRILPVQIDLGGMAKGFAVDQAVDAILSRGISGYVNAGGDVRVFGSKAQPVWIRSETKKGSVLRQVEVKNRSLATSSVFPEKSVYVDILRKKPLSRRKTISVLADQCLIADALTKIGLLMSPRAASRIASDYGATMKVFS